MMSVPNIFRIVVIIKSVNCIIIGRRSKYEKIFPAGALSQMNLRIALVLVYSLFSPHWRIDNTINNKVIVSPSIAFQA